MQIIQNAVQVDYFESEHWFANYLQTRYTLINDLISGSWKIQLYAVMVPFVQLSFTS